MTTLLATYREKLSAYKAHILPLSKLTLLEREDMDELAGIAHRMAGSGKAYGFPELSRIGRALERATDASMRLAAQEAALAIAPHLQALLYCLENITDTNEQSVVRDDNPVNSGVTVPFALDKTILLVDDDSDFSAQLSTRLTQHGYQVQCLDDIYKLAATVTQHDPVAIIVDMDFYGKRYAGAKQVTMWRENDGVPLPVIFVSAFDSFDVRLAAVRAGGNHFLGKPLDTDRLLSLLSYETSLSPVEPYRILLVDDDADLLSLYESALRHVGYRVFTATHAKEAMTLLEQEQPELVLIDVYMPDCDGIELGRMIRQHEQLANTPLLFVSSSTDTDIQLAAARLANDEFINKPLEPWRLLMVVKSRVTHSRHIQSGGSLIPGPAPHEARDSLTALLTLKSFRLSLQEALQQRQPDHLLAVLKIDIRDFHTVNNLYGHHCGDQVLQRLAWELSQCIKPGDLLCRESGDEFLVLTQGHDSRESVAKLAGLLIDCIEQVGPRVEQGTLALTADTGIALGPKDADTADALLNCADTALFLAKSSPSSEVSYFTPALQQEAQTRFSLVQDIKQALRAREFIATYQPVSSVSDGKVVGFEALARWQHPKRGLLGPDAFIPVMEEQGLVEQLTAQMLDLALRQLSRWQAVQPQLFMSVNLSARDIQNPSFLEPLKGLMAELKLEPASIVLEITETALLADWKHAAKTIGSLRAIGIELALDDFGTGYSSLSYLSRIQATKLKIDRSFIHSWSQSGSAQLLETIVQLGQTMDMEVVAEGVERTEELDFLRSLKCDFYQGYLSAKPMLASEIERDHWV
jgi:diguanylate cyclase (GGDEF)-like protein